MREMCRSGERIVYWLPLLHLHPCRWWLLLFRGRGRTQCRSPVEEIKRSSPKKMTHRNTATHSERCVSFDTTFLQPTELCPPLFCLTYSVFHPSTYQPEKLRTVTLATERYVLTMPYHSLQELPALFSRPSVWLSHTLSLLTACF